MNTPIPAPDVRPEPGAITRSCILALDLGTSTGWALRGHDSLMTSGTVSLRPGRFDGGGMRYLRFTNWLNEIDRLSGPVAAIWFEEVRRHAGTDAAHVFGGLLATLTAWAELRGVPYAGVPVGTIKRHAAGKGNADKVAMVAAVRARGFSPADDSEPGSATGSRNRANGDAIALLLWALDTKGGPAMRWHPRGYGGRRRGPERVKREGWQEQGVLAVSVDDDRLTWPERELVRQLGEKLYGPRAGDREAAHG